MMKVRHLVQLILEWVVVLVMVLTSLVGTGTMQFSPNHTRQAGPPSLTQPVSSAHLAPVQSSPAYPVGTWYAPHQPVYGPQSVIPTTPTLPQGRKPGEQPDLRTASTETFLNADGTWTLKAYPFPIHYKDAQGNWQLIDTTLTADGSESGYAYGNRANSWRVHFAAQAGGPALVSAQFPQVKVAETLNGAARTPEAINGSTIVYPGVFPGVDLRYGVGAISLEEMLLLHTAQAPASYTFTYHIPGATASQDAAGDVIFTNAKGDVLLVIGGVLMYESDAQGKMLPKAALTGKVQLTLAGTGPDFTITYTPDQTWLSDPKRHFPVAIDPTWQGSDPGTNTSSGNIYGDTIDESGNPTLTFWNLNSLRIGNANVDSGLCCNGTSRAYLKFPINPPPSNVRVTSATLKLYQSSQYSGGGVQINANAVMSAWNETTLTWNNHPTNFETVGSANTAATQNNWVSFDVSAAAQEWWSGGIALNGFELQYKDETKPQEFFFSDNNTNSQKPTLTINYVQDTTAPGGGAFFNTNATSTNNTTVTVAPAGSDTGSVEEWSSNWATVNGVGTTDDPTPNLSVDSTQAQLNGDTSPCGSTACWTQATFTQTISVTNWPTFTVLFKTDSPANLYVGVISHDNVNTRFEVQTNGSNTAFTKLDYATSAGVISQASINIPFSANTWYEAQISFPLSNVGEMYIWPVGQTRLSAPSVAWAGIYMTNPVLNFFLKGDNGANLHHLTIGNVQMTSKDTSSSTTGYGIYAMQFSTDGTNYGCPTYNGSNTSFSGGSWCVYSTQRFSWTFPTGDGKKTLWWKYVDNASNVGAGSSQIIYDTTAPVVNFLATDALGTTSANGREVRGLVNVTVNATDPAASDGSASGIASAVLYVDGVQAGTPALMTVATFLWDTTNLSPGEHVLTAKATDAAGNVGAIGGSTTVIVSNTTIMPYETFASRTLPDGATQVSVDVANGDAIITHKDLDIPGRGPDLSISRTYHALGYLGGFFGTGWTSELDERVLHNNDNSVTYYDADGGVHIFLPNGSGGFLTSPGLYLMLVENPDFTYTLTSRDQSKTNFNTAGYLESVVDRNGNTLSVTYDSNNNPKTVTDAAGRTLSIAVTTGHVTQITDPASRTYLYAYDGSGNLTGYTDPSGVVTHYTYDSSHRMTTITLNYVSGGAQDQQTNVVTSLAYDTTSGDSSYNRLTGLVDPMGYVVNFGYSLWGNNSQTIVSQQQGISPATYENTTYRMTTEGMGAVYELIGAMNGVPSPAGQLSEVTQYLYDANENLTQVTDPDGHVVFNTYDLATGNRLTQTVDPIGLNLKTTWTYDSANNVLTQTDPRGIVTQYTYDSPTTGNLIKVVHDATGTGGVTDPVTTTLSTYDSYGEILTTTDPLGIVTTYTYDTQGDVLTATANYVASPPTPLPADTNVGASATYDVLGEKLTATSAPTASVPLGIVTSYGYDILGHLIQTIANYQASAQPDQQTNVKTLTSYDPLGRQVTVTNPLGYVTLSTYDKDGRVTQTTRDYVSGGATDTDTNVLWSVVIYDATGNVLVSKDAKTLSGDPTGNITTTTYDLDNRPMQATVTDNASTPHILQNSRTVYDNAGLIMESDVLSLDGKNTVVTPTSFTQDGAGRQATQTDPPAIPGFSGFLGTSNVTTTTYDADGNAIDTKETNTALSGPITESTTTYDKLNRPLTKTEQANTSSAQTSSFTYDVDGRQLTFTDPANNVTTSSYDALGRVLTVTHPGTPTVIDYTTYDPAGERLSQCNSAGITSDTYDALGRVVYEEHDTITGSCPSNPTKTFQSSVTTTYDANGNKRSQLTNFPGGTSSTYSWTYDKLDRPVTMSDGTRVYTYDLNGNITKMTVGNFIETDISYDGENRANTFTDKVSSSGTTLHSYGYTYDAQGDQNQISTDGVATTYSYDALLELTKVQQGSTTTNYTYDANGNRATMVTSAGTTTYTYDSADVELTSKKDPTTKVTNYTYDTNGNLTKAVYDPSGANQTTTYTFDKNNRLTGVTEPNGTVVTFTYDADGNRISKAVTSGGSTTTINDVYALGHLDHQTDGSGNIIATYTYDTNGVPASVVVGAPTTGTRYYYVYNGHGDVVALTDNTGAVKASYSYDAFGTITAISESIPNAPAGWSNPYRYDGAQGVRYDPETGLYWMSVRAYDPTLGRFISHDPLGRLAALGLNTQPYVYTGNNPVNNTDPSGMMIIGPNGERAIITPTGPIILSGGGGCVRGCPATGTPTPTPTVPPGCKGLTPAQCTHGKDLKQNDTNFFNGLVKVGGIIAAFAKLAIDLLLLFKEWQSSWTFDAIVKDVGNGLSVLGDIQSVLSAFNAFANSPTLKFVIDVIGTIANGVGAVYKAIRSVQSSWWGGLLQGGVVILWAGLKGLFTGGGVTALGLGLSLAVEVLKKTFKLDPQMLAGGIVSAIQAGIAFAQAKADSLNNENVSDYCKSASC